jgi:putative peptidoglycan lipid II flippase
MNFDWFFNSKTKTVTGAAGILAISGFISRILGVIRDGLLAKTFGAGLNLDIYLAAFRIPDLVYNILIAGGIVVAFLPLFSEYFLKDKDKVWELTSNLLNVFLFLLVFLSLLLFLLTPLLMKFIIPGFNPQAFERTVFLTRLMYLSPILFGLSAIFSGILQYFDRFLVYSLCPIFYNLGIIFGILFLTSRFGILGVVFGVILGAFLHFAIQIPSAINCGFKWKPLFDFKDVFLRRTFLLMLPRTLGIAAQQINLIVITAIASTLSAGSITIFNFANNIQHFPVGIIGISFAVAAFPHLSQLWIKGKREEFISDFSLAFRQILYLIVPLSFLIFLLREQIIAIVLRHGQFSLLSAQLTSAALGIFSLGIFAFSLIPLIFRSFFSFQDTKTPTFIAILGIILNIVLSFYLTWLLSFSNILQKIMIDYFNLKGILNIEVLGLPLAFAISGIFQFILLMVFLYKKIGDYRIGEIFNSLFKTLIASFFMVISVNLILKLTVFFFSSLTFSGAFWQTIISGFSGIVIYFAVTWLLRSAEIETLRLPIFK